MKKKWYIALVVGVALLGSFALVGARSDGIFQAAGQTPVEEQEGAAQAQEDYPSGQPIAFPHNRHASEFQIDCQYCHFSAERSSAAGVPPVATCMGCHTTVSGSENAVEISRLREYWERGEAIPWNRIYKLPDHVQFPHMRHVAAEVECSECHGNVEEIGVIQSVAQPLTMGWCLNCHMELGASRDCTVCHY